MFWLCLVVATSCNAGIWSALSLWHNNFFIELLVRIFHICYNLILKSYPKQFVMFNVVTWKQILTSLVLGNLGFAKSARMDNIKSSNKRKSLLIHFQWSVRMWAFYSRAVWQPRQPFKYIFCFLNENVFIWSLHFYKVNIKEETKNTANCFIQPKLMPFRLTVSLNCTHLL